MAINKDILTYTTYLWTKKNADGSLTGISLPKENLPSTVAYTNAANTFIEAQTFGDDITIDGELSFVYGIGHIYWLNEDGSNAYSLYRNDFTTYNDSTTSIVTFPNKTGTIALIGDDISNFNNNAGFVTTTSLNTILADYAKTSDLSKYLPLTGGTLTGTLVAPIIQTGTNASNYFQSQKFRGQGDANTYYHAIDFGYANHDHVDFYEYGGTYNFWRNTTSTATTDTSNRVASLQLGKLLERGNTLTYPNKSGTFALTSDIPTVPTVNDATLTIQKNGSSVGTFTANASTDKTINIIVPTKTSDLTNDSGYITSSVTELTNFYTKTSVDNLLSSYATKTELDTKQDAGNYITYTNHTATVAGTSKTVSKISPETIFVPNGLVMGGTAANAGLVTRGVQGCNSPNATTGACNKDHLYLNCLENQSYQYKVVLGANILGTALTGGAYNYTAVRGDEMVSYVTSRLGSYVPTTTTVNGHALSSNITVSKSDVGLGSVVNTGDSATPVSGGTTKFTTGGAYTLQTSINAKYTKPSTGIPAADLADTYVVANADITAGTGTKITYDKKGLVTGSASLSASDIPSLDASKITSGTFADARIASASTWNAKQAALVSGTNIKTINGSSVLGSGNLTVTSTSDDVTNKSTLTGNTLTNVLNNTSSLYVTTPLTMDTSTSGTTTLGLDTSALVTQSSYATDKTEINNEIATLEDGKQDKLVSGTNIKTINSASILGSGNLSATYYQPKANKNYMTSNYSTTTTAWTYKTTVTGSSSYIFTVFQIKYLTSASGGGVGVNTSNTSFTQSSYSSVVGISTTPGSSQWGTLTILVPAGVTYYLWTKMTTTVYISYNYVSMVSANVSIS